MSNLRMKKHAEYLPGTAGHGRDGAVHGMRGDLESLRDFGDIIAVTRPASEIPGHMVENILVII
jgi:hypothetical protein